jgi:hypothetical protein
MSSVVISGNTSGTITLDAPAVAGTTTLTLPATTGTFITTTGGVTPSTAGNILTSDGTTWTSAAPSGGVTSLNGQTGAITNTTLYAIGSYINGRPANITSYGANSTIAGSSLYSTTPSSLYRAGKTNAFGSPFATASGSGATLINTGTWRCTAAASESSSVGLAGLWVRIS